MGSSSAGSLWPDGILYYTFDSSLTTSAKTKILAAIDHWNTRTPVRIEARSNQTDYVNFVNNSGCASYIGRQGGSQPIYASANCSVGNFIHEIGHALGLYHEHTRPDRDSYVTVHWENITANRNHNFDIVDSNITMSTPYDYDSIMHYGKTFFSNNGENTITPKDPNANIGQRDALSDDDLNGISVLYNLGFSATVEIAARKPMPNSNFSVDVSLLNNTGSNLQSTTATIDIPASVTFQQVSGTSWSCSSNSTELNCTGPSIANGAKSDFQLVFVSPNNVETLNFGFNFTAQKSSGAQVKSISSDTLHMTAVNDPPTINTDAIEETQLPSSYLQAIGQIEASDLNGHALSNFSVASQSQADVLRVDANSGEVFATSDAALAVLKQQTVYLGVTVSDGLTVSAAQNIEVREKPSSGGSGGEGSSGGGGGGGAFLSFWLLLLLPLRRVR
eukprot:snap_masked-scaffold4536_size5787-processed-gene-0.1 protein:Tk11115 transcript:snap_masked-scaffold4536_size5787-processed-gene-0.1-mRNA-1 annotation:"high choriolytic enzyme 2-like"